MRFKASVRKLSCLVALGGLACSLIMVSPAVAASASTRTASTTTCSGSLTAPGVLKGTYHGNVTVSGICFVNSGPAIVKGNLTVAAGGGLDATFALNDGRKSGHSYLKVTGNVYVKKGAVLIMGCDPGFSPCSDDPNPKSPSLSSWDWIDGNLTAIDALGVILHNNFIGGNVIEQAGGGGVTCTPEGIFAAFKSPVFSDYENVVIGGSMSISDITSCWYGTIRDFVRGNLTLTNNKMADPDALEVVNNFINGSFSCLKNSPAILYGDSGGSPDVVGGTASGQCSFTSFEPNPPPNGPLDPISVPETA